jgi:hypothetical protein
MKRTTLRSALALAGLLVGSTTTAAAASPPTSMPVVASWTDAHADDLVRAWGVPTSTYTLSDGGRLLTYDTSRAHVNSTPLRLELDRYTPGQINQTGGGVSSYTQWCRIQFETDAAGRIRRTSWTGGSGLIRHHCITLLKGKPAWGGR